MALREMQDKLNGKGIDSIIDVVISEERKKEGKEGVAENSIDAIINGMLGSKRTPKKEEKKMDHSSVDPNELVPILYKGVVGIYKMNILPLKHPKRDYRRIPMPCFDDIARCIEKIGKKTLTDYVQFIDTNIVVNAMGPADYEVDKSLETDEFLKRKIGILEESASYGGEINIEVSLDGIEEKKPSDVKRVGLPVDEVEGKKEI